MTKKPEPSNERARRLAARFQDRDQAAEAAGPVEQEDASPTATAPPAAPVEEQSTAASRPKMGLYISAEIQEAARDAWWWTRNELDGAENISEWVEQAIKDRLDQVYAQHNDGRPFPERPRKRLPHARR